MNNKFRYFMIGFNLIIQAPSQKRYTNKLFDGNLYSLDASDSKHPFNHKVKCNKYSDFH